ncbi:MAG: hypothetical protein PHO15_10860 [Eubacteriales bacterium]|nr:hypothetical protein [Eubacteriales bacterium]
MAEFTEMAFSPATGLNDKETYTTTPASEEEAREQVQGISDQIRDYINEALLPELENAETGASGAERIGSAAIENVTGETVRTQIADLKSQIDDISAGSVADGSITTEKLAEDAVTQEKIADDAVGADQIVDGAVTEGKIGAGAVVADNFADGVVSEAKIAGGAVTAAKIGTGAVTETKIGTGAVTETKIGTGAVTAAKIGAGAVTAAKIGTGAVTTAKLGLVSSITLGDNDTLTYDDTNNYLKLVTDGSSARKIPTVIVSTSSPSGTYPDGTIWIKY